MAAGFWWGAGNTITILRYYNTRGQVKAVSMSSQRSVFPVEFYVETISLPGVKGADAKTGREIPLQLSAHSRGVLVSILAAFEPLEERIFTYEEQPAPSRHYIKLIIENETEAYDKMPDLLRT